MNKSHIWGFHCFVPIDLYIVMLNRFIVFFSRQDQLTKLSGQYDAVTCLATFEVAADTTINRDSIRYMETRSFETSVTIHTFSNEDGLGEACEALFLAVSVGSLPSIVAQSILSQTMLCFARGTLSSSHVAEHENVIFISVVAVNDFPDLLAERINSLVVDLSVYYKNRISFPKQTK